MCAAVELENVVVEVLDPEAQTRDAQAPDRGQLALGERSRLALERDLFSVVPWATAREPFDEPVELLRRQKRRRAAAEVHEIEWPSGDGRQLAVQLPLARQHVEVLVHFLCVLVGVDPEVTEVTALAAERNVQVDAERDIGSGADAQRRHARRERPPQPTTPRTADKWRRNNCRPRSARPVPGNAVRSWNRSDYIRGTWDTPASTPSAIRLKPDATR